MMPYFANNLPLQVWPPEEGDDPESSRTRILNYMPRREAVLETTLEDLIGDEEGHIDPEVRRQFFLDAARCFDNLARLMRGAAEDPTMSVYYHNKGMDDADR